MWPEYVKTREHANQTIIEARSTESPDDIFDRILAAAQISLIVES